MMKEEETIYIVIAILIFGMFIFTHELGHYITARIFGVTIHEFAIGMGPRMIQWTSEKTDIVYSLRMLPFGGFVSMMGEDEEVYGEGSLNGKPCWQRIIITAAGSFMNILLGFILMFSMVISAANIGSTVVAEFDTEDAVTAQCGLEVGDRITRIDGVRVHTSVELAYEIMRRGIEPVDLIVERNGKEITLKDVTFPKSSSEGMSFGDIDFSVAAAMKTPANVIKATWYQSISSIKMIWESLFDLITGRYGMEQVSGPIGVTEAIGDAAKTGSTSLLYLCTLIAMNLGVFNLLPFPALDGGRIAFLIVELIRGKPVKPEIEGYVHFAGIVVLMAFMVAVTFKDIVGLFVR